MQGHPWDSSCWGLPGTKPLWAPQALSSLQAGPADSLARSAEAGRAGRALPGLPCSPLLPAPAPLLSLLGCRRTRGWGLRPGLPREACRRRPRAGLLRLKTARGEVCLPPGSRRGVHASWRATFRSGGPMVWLVSDSETYRRPDLRTTVQLWIVNQTLVHLLCQQQPIAPPPPPSPLPPLECSSRRSLSTVVLTDMLCR